MNGGGGGGGGSGVGDGDGGLTDFRVGLRPWRTLRNISFEAAI